MKNLLSILSVIIITSNVLFSQQKQEKNGFFKSIKPIGYYFNKPNPEQYLHLSPAWNAVYVSKNYSHDSSSDKKKFTVALIGGIAFMTAAILEGDGQYGTWVNTSYNTQRYVTQPFMRQTPRNIMFFTGVGLTLTSVIALTR